MEKEVEEKRKRLSPEATVLLTIGGFAVAIIVFGIVHFIIGS